MPIELITAVPVYELQLGWGLAKGIIIVIFKKLNDLRNIQKTMSKTQPS